MANLTPKGYCDVADIEAYILTEVLDSFKPNVLNWIAQIEEHIERVTDRVFIADTVASDRYYDGNGGSEQFIDECVEISSVVVYDENYAEDSTPVENTDFFSFPYNTTPKYSLILKPTSDAEFLRGIHNVKVSAKWGYSVNVPAPIRFATMVLVAGIVNFSNNAEGEVKSERIGEYSVTYKDDSGWGDLERAKEILSNYSKPNV